MGRWHQTSTDTQIMCFCGTPISSVDGRSVPNILVLLSLQSRGPVPVLVMSLLFIASVFMLHIWGKYTRG